MRIHFLKTWPEYFEAMLIGIKHCEYRKNDRGFKVGDLLVLQEYDPGSCAYSSRSLTVKVTHLLQDVLGLPDGFCIMSVEVIRE